MKKNLLMCLLVSSVLFSQISNAQTRKEKRLAKKQKGKVEQIDSTAIKQNNGKDRPGTIVKPATSNQIDGKTPQQNNGNTISKNPITTSSDKKPQQPENINLNEIASNSKPMVTERPNGSINWTEQYIEAKGSSVIDTVKFKNKAQAKAMATRGAVVVTQRNLLEIIKGVNVTSETTVKDMIAQGDYVYTRVDGVVKGAEMVGDAIEKNGMIEVKMRVPLYQRNGLASALYDNIPQNKNLKVSQTTQGQQTKDLQDQVLNGLALNLNGKTFDPSLFPLVVDESGNLVFDFSKIYDPKTGDFPKVFNATETLFKEFGFNKGVEYLNVLRTEPGKIVLDEKNIKKINWGKIAQTAGTIGKFLMMFI